MRLVLIAITFPGNLASRIIPLIASHLFSIKFKADGLSESALKMLKSYLTNRQQCVKIDLDTSELLYIVKGSPEDSIFGPILFYLSMICFSLNTNVNYIIMQLTTVNTISKSDKSLEKVIASLEDESKSLIDWFLSIKCR